MALQDQLNQATQSIGKIVKEPGREGGDDRFFTESGAWAQKVGDNRYRVAILGNTDANGTPGRGAYMVEVDGNGAVVRQPYYQNTTNHDWSGLAAFVLTAAGGMMASGAFGGAGASAGGVGGWVSGFDLAGGGGLTAAEQAAAQVVASQISSLGPAATAGDIINAIAGGGLSATGAATVLKALPSGLKTIVASVVPGLFKADGSLDTSKLGSLLAGGIGLAGAYSAIDSLKNQGTVAQNAYNDLGTGMFNDYNALGQNILGLNTQTGSYMKDAYAGLGGYAETKFNDLGKEGQGLFNTLGNNANNAYNEMATKYENKYNAVTNQLKDQFKDFTPWSLKTTIGSSNGTDYTLNPSQQAIVDSASKTASNAFGAANAIDLNDLRNQEYNLMQQTYAPKDEADRIALENRLRAQGRLGLNYGTYGSSPEQIALQEGIRRRDLQSYLQADENAQKRYQGLVSSGVSASGVPTQYDQQGLQTLQAGTNMASTAYNNELQGGRLWSDQANRAINAAQGLETTGANSLFSNQGQGINYYLGQKGAGIDKNLGFFDKGLQQQAGFAQRGITAAGDYASQGLAGKYQNMAKGIAAKLGSDAKALEALIKLYNGITGSNLTSTSSGATPTNVINAITSALKSQGVPDNVIEEYIMNNTDPLNQGGIFEPNYSAEDIMGMFQ